MPAPAPGGVIAAGLQFAEARTTIRSEPAAAVSGLFYTGCRSTIASAVRAVSPARYSILIACSLDDPKVPYEA
jgi:hypothetical protein